MESIHIQTKSKEYDVYVGKDVLPHLMTLVRDMTPAVSNVMIISDEAVAAFHLQTVIDALQVEQKVFSFVVPSGEKEKSFENFYAAHTSALENKMDRNSLVIALGGGMIGDLAGFVAASFMRGVRFIQVPTTLLAHDSAVGGKVAINHPLGKNMIGAFHQPEAVLYHTPFLSSLPEQEWRSGFAEVMKHALIGDVEFYQWLKKEVKTLEDVRDEKLIYILKRAIPVKAKIVAQDETEKGVRAHLNFGHTLGHALEKEMGYGNITHGDGVAIGMLFAMFLSEQIYNVDLAYKEMKQWFSQYGYPNMPRDLSVERLVQVMKQDKKASAGTIHMVLMQEYGVVNVVSISDETVHIALEAFQKDMTFA
ncbi:3-dehydroquinate synthase [Bacillus clarus]|uniref:3-dehydroquinate synthase n=1 Tax=Bacillus clarus TaxID=2338372 RepID=A0A090YIB4_9BACI|nr:3-dehydroquinate synthase [Bacillus clarus]KFM98548.1 3-dehydroquinate synthase [Bacillus clarus]RFT68378.1 3-dehydroquinate synthase [Bacillus clarus]